jgi:tartrate-resistant acid phosphatase type 5
LKMGRSPSSLLLLVLLAALLAACQSAPAPASPTPTEFIPASPTSQASSPSLTPTEAPTLTPEPLQVRFAVIGDFGLGGVAEADVAALVHSWQPDIILTVGDNNYPLGAASEIDEHIGQFYQDYIFPYTGTYGPGAQENRFFPTLGNHDWYTTDAQPYLDYFTLPGNERYYDFTWGPVHFFALDSDEHEPDGVRRNSVQAAWLEERITVSASPWQVVFFHHAAYSSAHHGSSVWMQWPFAALGADVVLAGHDHDYERLFVDGIPYFVNGSGGGGLYNFDDPLPETQFRYNADNGAMLVTATETDMLFEFYSRTGILIDSYTVTKP